MTKPIGRAWINEDCISGYILIGQVCIKFAFDTAEKVNWIYPSKKETQKKQ